MWLKLCFGSHVAALAKSHSHLEVLLLFPTFILIGVVDLSSKVDESRLPEGEHLNVNKVNLQARAKEFLEAILRIGDTCPTYHLPSYFNTIGRFLVCLSVTCLLGM